MYNVVEKKNNKSFKITITQKKEKEEGTKEVKEKDVHKEKENEKTREQQRKAYAINKKKNECRLRNEKNNSKTI